MYYCHFIELYDKAGCKDELSVLLKTPSSLNAVGANTGKGNVRFELWLFNARGAKNCRTPWYMRQRWSYHISQPTLLHASSIWHSLMYRLWKAVITLNIRKSSYYHNCYLDMLTSLGDAVLAMWYIVQVLGSNDSICPSGIRRSISHMTITLVYT